MASAGPAEDLVVGEFTGDAHLDVGAANMGFGLNAVSSLTNDGTGALSQRRDSPAGRPLDSLGQNGLATGDFNKDGRLDLAVVKLWENTFSLLVGDIPRGYGWFRPAVSLPSGAKPFDVVAADFDTDGNLDAAVSNFTDGSVSVYFGDGNIGFTTTTVTVGPYPTSLASGDLNLDGFADLVVTHNGGVSVIAGTPSRSLSGRHVAVPGTPNSVAMARMNADLLPDIVVADALSPSLRVLRNEGVGLGGLTAPFTLGGPIPTGSTFAAGLGGVATGDVDSDGLADVVVRVGNGGLNLPVGEPALWMLHGDGAGGLTSAASLVLGRDPTGLRLADMNGDSALDIVVADGAGIFVATNTCIPAVPFDIEATGAEIVQVVQDESNSVPLIEGKRTVVRGHVKATTTAQGITGRLVRLDSAGKELDGVLPVNPTGRITVRAAPARALADDSFRFEIPESWTHGALTVRLDVNPSGVPSERSSSNNSFTTSVAFQPAKTLKVTLVDYRWGICADADVDPKAPGLCKPGAVPVGFTSPFPRAEYPAIEADLRRKFPVKAVQVKTIGIDDSATVLPRQTLLIPGDVELNRVIALRQGLQSADPGTIFVWLSRSFLGGVAYMPQRNFPEHGWDVIAGSVTSVAHEVGHALNRGHTNCTGTEANVDAYPYPGGKIGGPTGAPEKYLGYAVPDSNGASFEFGAVVPGTIGDEMGYCSPRWPSDYSFRTWRSEIETRPGFLDPTGDFLLIGGTASTGGAQGSLDIVQRLGQVTTLTAVVPGAYSVRLLDASGNTLVSYPFTPTAVADHEGPGRLAFNEIRNWVAGTRAVVLVNAAGAELARRTVSAAAPQLSGVSHDGGAALPASGAVTVSWAGSDPDGDPVTSSVLYSSDGGTSWTLVATGATGSSLVLDAAALQGTGGQPNGRFRVVLSDGVLTAAGDTQEFAVPDKAPALWLASPVQGARVELGQGFTFEAVGLDPEDGVLDQSRITWSSSIDGPLGTGRLVVARLSAGTHTVIGTATDTAGHSSSAIVIVRVVRDLAVGSPPVADAGADVATAEGSKVVLDGSASMDPDGDSLSYAWQVVDAPSDAYVLEDRGNGTAEFVVPDDGTYRLRLTVSDGLNPATSDDVNILVANRAPFVTISTPTSGQLFAMGSVAVTTSFSDAGPLDEHTCTVNWDVDQSGFLDAGTVDQAARTCTATRVLGAGVYTIEVAVSDLDGGTGRGRVGIVVYDPAAGYVSGGGWIESPAGGYIDDPTLTGRANFGFVSAYKKGAATPTGQTEFSFTAGRMAFHSTSYQWLVVSGARAQYMGVGQLNGVAGYAFLLTAEDGNRKSATSPDRFRIKIWDRASGRVIYDNVPVADDDLNISDPQVIAGGSIVVHTPSKSSQNSW